MTSTSPEPVTTFSIVISFLVSVPVLSEQTTEAEPSVSTDESRFTIACRLAMLYAEREHDGCRTAGNPSGTAATARDTPTSRTETTSKRLRGRR